MADQTTDLHTSDDKFMYIHNYVRRRQRSHLIHFPVFLMFSRSRFLDWDIRFLSATAAVVYMNNVPSPRSYVNICDRVYRDSSHSESRNVKIYKAAE